MKRDMKALGIALVALTALAGCGSVLSRHRAEPTAAPAARGSDARDPMAEAVEQAALDPREPYWPFRIGQLRLAADSVATAEEALKAALERDPRYVPALSLLSKLWFDQRRHAEAVALLEPLRSGSGHLPPVLLTGLALHYDALDQTERAAVALREAQAAGDASTVAAFLSLRGDAPDSARAPADRALSRDPGSAANHNNHGITRLRAGDPETARRDFLRAIEIDPALPGPYYNLAILDKYFALDDTAAARWFDQYWTRSHDDPDSLFGVFHKAAAKSAAREE